jgi:hypothetical protein
MGKSKPQTAQTVTSEPAAFIKPYLTQAAQESQNLFNEGGQQYFTGSTYVPFSPESEISLQAQTARALQGSPLNQAAQQETLRTATGGYLSGSPALQQELGRVQGLVNSQFAKGGGYRSSANQEALTRDLSRAVIGNYNTERQLQQQAIQNAPQMANIDYGDIQQLGQVGAAREDLFSRQLQDQINRFNFLQNQKPENLQNYIKNITALGGLGAPTQTTTSPTAGRSIIGGAASGASAGAGLATALGSVNPAFAIGGAALGALFG